MDTILPLDLPRSLHAKVGCSHGSSSQLPFLSCWKDLDRRFSQVFGVELGTEPYIPFFLVTAHDWQWPALPGHFPLPWQEEAFLGCLVYPNCFFEVSAVWGMEICMQGWDITLCAKTWAAVARESMEYYLLVFWSSCFFSVGYREMVIKPPGLVQTDVLFHWPVFCETKDVDLISKMEAEIPHFLHESFEL